MNNINIGIITNIIPLYREGFYDRLFARKGINAKVYCQAEITGMDIRSIHRKFGNHVSIVKYLSAKNEIIVWQRLPWREIRREYDVVFIDGNPRILSSVVLSILLRYLNNNVVLWTMAHSFRSNSFTERLRYAWSKIFPYIFVYTDGEVEYLRIKGFRKQYILGMNNGLDQARIDSVTRQWPDERLREWRSKNHIKDKKIILSCSRLIKKNRFDLVINAMPRMIKYIPDIYWCVIGDGEEKEVLMEMATETGLLDHLLFLGEIHDEKALAPWFLSATAFVHPAAVGLSLLHAFGYGLPAVTHGRKEFHGPEYETFENGLTGYDYSMGDANSLGEAIIKIFRNKDQTKIMKEYVLEVAREKFNVDVMVERFVKIAMMSLNKR